MPGSAPRSAGWPPKAGQAQRYLSGLSLDPRQACNGPQGGAGGLKGTADEGGAAHLHHSRRLAGPNMPASWAQLQANAPAMGWAFRAAARMATELGPDWQSKFANFEKEGRVRRLSGPSSFARDPCKNGTEAAAKLQYPDHDGRRWKPTSTS